MGRKKIPEIPDGAQDDGLAKDEERAFEAGSYEKESRRSEHGRSESVKKFLHYAAVAIFFEFVFIYMLLLGGWALHLMLPEAWRFWTPDQFDKIQAIVLSGVVASALSKYYERYMK